MSSLRRWLGTRVHCRCIGPQVLPVVRTILQRDAQLPDVIVHALTRVVHSLLELSSSEAAPKPPGVCESLNEARLRLKGDSVHSEQSISIADTSPRLFFPQRRHTGLTRCKTHLNVQLLRNALHYIVDGGAHLPWVKTKPIVDL